MVITGYTKFLYNFTGKLCPQQHYLQRAWCEKLEKFQITNSFVKSVTLSNF
jgi:hypothetical protein